MNDDVPAIPVPEPSAVSAPYWDATKSKTLTMQRCANCRRLVWYPRFVCPHCGATNLSGKRCPVAVSSMRSACTIVPRCLPSPTKCPIRSCSSTWTRVHASCRMCLASRRRWGRGRRRMGAAAGWAQPADLRVQVSRVRARRRTPATA